MRKRCVQRSGTVVDNTASMTPSLRHKQPAAKTSPSRRVLIVDDEAAILFAYKRLIEREGIGVDSCASFEEALSLIQARSYRAIIADLRLTGTGNEDGLEVLHAARDMQPEAGVIMVTGYGSPETRNAALSLGAAHYFEKPVLPRVILAALMELVGRAVPADGGERVFSRR